MFESFQIALLVCSILAYAVSFYSLNRGHIGAISVFLFLSALFLFVFATSLDSFLHLWDERYHALVARNMMTHPFKPMLYSDLALNQDYEGWYKGHVWLHKQPLFMWQMALSMKVFGINLFALRLPSALLSAAMVVAIYRSGKLLVNTSVGFIAATLMLSSYWWFGLVAGRHQMDHNDVAFLCYISMSIWAWIEYQQCKKWYWLIFIGAFSGAAVLCKWLAGLFVFGIWGIYGLLNLHQFKFQFTSGLAAIAISTLIFLPWQLYASSTFPEIYEAEQAHNWEHLTTPLSYNTPNDYLYYVRNIGKTYNIVWAGWLLIGLFVFPLSWKYSKIKVSMIVGFCVQLAFFSLAQSKMPSYTLVGWLIALLAIANLFYLPIKLFYKTYWSNYVKTIILTLFIVFIITIRLFLGNQLPFAKTASSNQDESYSTFTNSVLEFESNKCDPSHIHNKLIENTKLLKSIRLDDNYVLFNVNGLHIIEAMFYTGIPVYNNYPKENEIIELLDKDRRIAVIKSDKSLPDYFNKYPEIELIDGEINVVDL